VLDDKMQQAADKSALPEKSDTAALNQLLKELRHTNL
jgi:hypothetical protein